MKKIISKYNLALIIGIIFLISIPACFGLFHKGFFVTDDGEWMIIRFSAFYQAIADGQFPVRFLHRLNFDFGYPVATFLYPGFMYLGIPFHLLKIGYVETIKILFGISLFGTTTFTYLWLNKLFNKKITSLVGAVVSLYLPYHLYDVYTRGSLGEIFALMWVPFMFWMVERKNFFFLTIGIFLLLLSHNTLALLFLPLIFIYALLRKTVTISRLIISFVLGIFLSSFFIIPAIFELSYTNFSKTIIAEPGNYFADLSLIGILTIVVFIFAGLLFIFRKKSQSSHTTLTQLFLLITFFVVFLSSSWSQVIWQVIPSSFIQFPFRLLSYLVISVAFLVTFIVSELQGGLKKIIVITVMSMMLLATLYQYGNSHEFVDKGEGFYFTNEATTTVQDEYMPIWVKEKPTQRADQKIEVMNGEAKIENIAYNNKEITFTVSSEGNTDLRINTVYWPGWKVFIDNTETDISYSNPKGLIEFVVTKGNHKIKAEFGETPLRLFSDSLSIVGFVILLGMVVRREKKS